MELINKGITLTVFKVTNGEYYIGNQSDKHLMIAMRATYHEHARNLPYNIKGQINRENSDFMIIKTNELKENDGFLGLNDKSNPEVIKQMLQMSKKTFKKN